MVAYRIQVDRQGDLDRETRQLLDAISTEEDGSSVIARLKAFDHRQTKLARGRHWLDELVCGSVTSISQLAERHRCTERQVNLTLSLAFLAPGPREGCSRRSSAAWHRR